MNAGRPQGVGTAWVLTCCAVAAHAVVWVLGAFVVAPTGLDELTATSGAGGAARQLALSGGVLAVFLAGWLAVGLRMRAGRGWARHVLAVIGAGSLLFLATDFSMSGGETGLWPLLSAVPDLVAAAVVVPVYLPALRSRFPAGPHRT
ncbi:hypothetical protein [Streptomyces sp. NPDC090112]|uniref:hypothetical protein n=1 Tax=Streptomyces sp. NPDC090112 TaxID=3365949 RepID=UPI0037F23C68